MTKIDTLEPRRLLSGGPMMISPDRPVGFTLTGSVDGGLVLTETATGESVPLPSNRPGKPMTVIGSPNADQITVERVTGLPTEPSGEEFQAATLYNDQLLRDGSVVSGLSALTQESMQDRIDHELGVIAQREAKLAAYLDDENTQPWLIEWEQDLIAQSRQLLGQYQALLAEVNSIPTTEFMRYHLEGWYDIYVEITPETMPSRLVIEGGDGNDNIGVSTNVPMRASLAGDGGADILTGGRRATNIYGGSGNDRLISRSLQGGLLEGGRGVDRYFNRQGEVNISTRNDGDRIVLTDRSLRVAANGIFGVNPVDRRHYMLVDGVAGQVDLLA